MISNRENKLGCFEKYKMIIVYFIIIMELFEWNIEGRTLWSKNSPIIKKMECFSIRYNFSKRPSLMHLKNVYNIDY